MWQRSLGKQQCRQFSWKGGSGVGSPSEKLGAATQWKKYERSPGVHTHTLCITVTPGRVVEDNTRFVSLSTKEKACFGRVGSSWWPDHEWEQGGFALRAANPPYSFVEKEWWCHLLKHHNSPPHPRCVCPHCVRGRAKEFIMFSQCLGKSWKQHFCQCPRLGGQLAVICLRVSWF